MRILCMFEGMFSLDVTHFFFFFFPGGIHFCAVVAQIECKNFLRQGQLWTDDKTQILSLPWTISDMHLKSLIIPTVNEASSGVYSFCLFRNNVCVCLCVCILFFVKDFSGTTGSRILKLATNIGWFDLLYCVRETQVC